MSDAPLSLDALRTLTSVQAATRWIACETPDAALFAQWLAESDDNRAAWRKAQLVWGVFDHAADDAMIAAMARAARHVGPEPLPEPAPAPANDRGWPRLVAAAAAVGVIATTLTFGMQEHWFGGGPPAKIASADRHYPLARFGVPDYVTGKGQTTIVDLPDGTRVTLAPDSALDLAYAGGRRDLRLVRGRGYFDVAHDAAHPFAVEVAGRLVTALGTRFDIDMAPGIVRVVLEEGSVSVGPAPGSRMTQPVVRLHPGEAFVAAGDKQGAVSATAVDRDLAWRQTFVAFDNRPLSEVIAVLNRSTRAQIVIRDPGVAAMRVTAQFRTGDIERFGRALSLALPVRIVARATDRYEIVRKR